MGEALVPILGAAGSLLGGLFQAGAAKSASQSQQQAAEAAIAAQQEMFGQVREDLSPFISAGAGAIPQLQNLLMGGAGSQAALRAIPGYQFTRDQGLRAVQNSATARGLGVSGPALTAAAQYATGLADNTYGNQVNRLMALMSSGANAAAGAGQISAGFAPGISNAMLDVGNAQAAGSIGGATAISGGIQGGLGFLNNWYQQQQLNQLLGGGGAGASPAGLSASQLRGSIMP